MLGILNCERKVNIRGTFKVTSKKEWGYDEEREETRLGERHAHYDFKDIKSEIPPQKNWLKSVFYESLSCEIFLCIVVFDILRIIWYAW